MRNAICRKFALEMRKLHKSRMRNAGISEEFQMREAMMKFMKASKISNRGRLKTAVILGMIGLGLSGCVVYPSNYGYGYGYGGGYYAAPAYYAPPVVVGIGGGWGWGGGWGGGWGRGYGGRWR